ncbi:hypothetical protein ACFE04_006200 [Oxalis oulophora]
MVASSCKQPSYEEFRRKRVEENKKRMEALNLPTLAKAFHNSSPKPSPMKPRITSRLEKHAVVVRRSGRIANNPSPVYKEILVDRIFMPKRYSSGRRDLLNRVYASDKDRTHAIDKAEQLESTLGTDYPSFVRPMLPSHVTGGFWLGLPSYFCKKLLPKDDLLTLIDENDEEYQTVYLAGKHGLSGGWRGFSIAHDLVDGDALVFQLTNPTTFKVYIVRANEPEDAQEA